VLPVASRRADAGGRGASVVLSVAAVATLALLAGGCGSSGTQRTSSGVTTTHTPEFSVSSTYSLPTAPPTAPVAPPTPATAQTSTALAGRTIAIDPGHNGGNASHPAEINRKVQAGGFLKECDTTGTETDAGYPEYAFTLDVALRAANLLRARGAKVVLTRTTSTGVGPCIDQRAVVGNRLGADAALSIHADGGPAIGVGFDVIRPGLLPGRNDDMVGPSNTLGTAIHDAMLGTGEPTANYVGSNGYDTRTDLGGLNLSTVPKVLVECGNMRNAADAARLTDPAFRQRIAAALAAGLTGYLAGG
jgi:N-acetylmuramoyl-L-alanine amidase